MSEGLMVGGCLVNFTLRKILTYPENGFKVIMVLEISPGTSVNDCNFRSTMKIKYDMLGYNLILRLSTKSQF